MNGAEISIQTYEQLVRESERLKVAAEFIKYNTCVTNNDLKIILGVHKSEKENKNIGENEE